MVMPLFLVARSIPSAPRNLDGGGVAFSYRGYLPYLLHVQRRLRDDRAAARDELDLIRATRRKSFILIDADVAGEHRTLRIDAIELLVGGQLAVLHELHL